MRILKVQGKGQVRVEPDLVTLSFAVDTLDKDYAASLQQLNARAEDLRASMTAAGLDRAKLKTTAFNVRVEHEYKSGKHIFIGYRAAHNFHIELPVDKQLLNRVLQQIARGHSGAQIGLTFSVRDQDDLRRRVLADAVRRARENAGVLAEASGITLGQLQQIDYGWAEVRIYDREASMACCELSEKSNGAADIEPEDVAAEDNVTLVFAIED